MQENGISCYTVCLECVSVYELVVGGGEWLELNLPLPCSLRRLSGISSPRVLGGGAGRHVPPSAAAGPGS